MLTAVKLALIFVHRWLGVALCLFFLIWFPSAIGMMYWDFPTVTPQDRLAKSAALDAATIVLSPARAFATLHTDQKPSEIRLDTFDARPVYRFRIGRNERVVYADTGEVRGDASADTMRRVAASWTGQSIQTPRVQSVDAIDQWTVQGPLRNLRPLWKFSWPDGQQVYVAQPTGEVVQYTTTASRIGAYLGPIPHWLYFTPLRQRQLAWTRVVVWSSGIATVAAAIGLVIALWVSLPLKRIPYRGQKRWHTIFGLIFGVSVMTWAFSGMLSMEPFPTERSPAPPPFRLRSAPAVDAFATRDPRDAIRALAPRRVKELELTSMMGEPTVVATLDGGVIETIPSLDSTRLNSAVTVAGATATTIDDYDAYYRDRRRERPLPVILAQLHDVDATRYYIDPRTAAVVASYSSRGWMNRWLYHGLHSLDFPWLYNRRPLWDVVVIAFMLGGTALSVTSVILAWRVVTPRL